MKPILLGEFDAAQRKLGTLLPRKWTTLYSAREHVLFAHIRRWRSQEEFEDMVNVLRGRRPATMFGDLFSAFDRNVRSFLVRAFGEGHIKTRGIEHRPGLEQVMLDPLPWNWWKRIADRGSINIAGPNDGFPIHMLSWFDGSISRCASGDGEPLATITDIEVDLQWLLKILPSRRAVNSDAAGDKNTWLMKEMLRRKESGEPHGRDVMRLAIHGEFPAITVRDADELIKKLPANLRAPPGRRKRQNPGRK